MSVSHPSNIAAIIASMRHAGGRVVVRIDTSRRPIIVRRSVRAVA